MFGLDESNIVKHLKLEKNKMAHAEVCPICSGRGTVKENTFENSITDTETICHGCGGKGWVTVQDEPEKETKFVTNENNKIGLVGLNLSTLVRHLKLADKGE